MSEKVYETVALVKTIEVCESKCVIKFHPVKKYSVDQYFLCLEVEQTEEKCFTEDEEKSISVEGTYKLLEDISVTLDCKEQTSDDKEQTLEHQKQEFEVLKIAALKALPVRIQFAEEQNQPENYKLCNVRVDF